MDGATFFVSYYFIELRMIVIIEIEQNVPSIIRENNIKILCMYYLLVKAKEAFGTTSTTKYCDFKGQASFDIFYKEYTNEKVMKGKIKCGSVIRSF